MELIKTKYICKGCEEPNELQVSFDTFGVGNCHLCQSCLIKALLMIRPIKFDNQSMLYWIKVKLHQDQYNRLGENIQFEKFINWIEPFLKEGK